MPERYTDRITAHCEARGIVIPVGFFRHPASRYVAIDMTSRPPRLVAKTWFTQEDVLYYLTHMAAEKTIQVLDFKDREELVLSEGQLHRHGGLF